MSRATARVDTGQRDDGVESPGQFMVRDFSTRTTGLCRASWCSRGVRNLTPSDDIDEF